MNTNPTKIAVIDQWQALRTNRRLEADIEQAGFSLKENSFTTPLLYGAVILSVVTALAAIVILIKESFVSASLIDEQMDNPPTKSI